ncbi:MAG: beta-phosphoglucomutase [Flavobacteriaceae bacterium]|nr:beta-phosphoglucomutase [Flavobacteriaceae bacterium]
MGKKGFIFDLDGVIVDTAKYHYLAWKKLANDIGISFSESQNEHLKGVSRIRSLEKILDWGGVRLNQEDFNELMAKKNEDYLRYIKTMNENEILPDVKKILNYLTQKGQAIALGSASKNARSILSMVSLKDEFDAIIDGNDVTKAKPDPEVFLKAASAINIKPERCIVFEDSLAGIQAANTANMVSIGIGDKDTLKEAEYVFKDFTEMDIDFIEFLIER